MSKVVVDRRRIEALCRWFRREARPLPWRDARSAYAALVSESMLQQTQVSRVVERFIAFMERFPTIEALAAADEQSVLAMWQGLGYYRRARLLHLAARQIVQQHGGNFPCSPASLERLPGVGKYTAGAIASIVFGQAAAMVDGNVARVIARWDGNDDPGPAPRLATAWRRSGALARAAKDPGELNEAMMELGAIVCTPRSPRCTECPVARWCEAQRSDRVHAIPPPKPTAAKREVHHHAVIVMRGSRVLLEKRPERGMWAGMWQVPTIEADRPVRAATLKAKLPVRVEAISRCGSFAHQTTHRRISFHVFATRSRARRGTWREAHAVSDLPLSAPQRKILAMVTNGP